MPSHNLSGAHIIELSPAAQGCPVTCRSPSPLAINMSRRRSRKQGRWWRRRLQSAHRQRQTPSSAANAGKGEASASQSFCEIQHDILHTLPPCGTSCLAVLVLHKVHTESACPQSIIRSYLSQQWRGVCCELQVVDDRIASAIRTCTAV